MRKPTRKYIIAKLVDGEFRGITRQVTAKSAEQAIDKAVAWWAYGALDARRITGRIWTF